MFTVEGKEEAETSSRNEKLALIGLICVPVVIGIILVTYYFVKKKRRGVSEVSIDVVVCLYPQNHVIATFHGILILRLSMCFIFKIFHPNHYNLLIFLHYYLDLKEYHIICSIYISV